MDALLTLLVSGQILSDSLERTRKDIMHRVRTQPLQQQGPSWLNYNTLCLIKEPTGG